MKNNDIWSMAENDVISIIEDNITPYTIINTIVMYSFTVTLFLYYKYQDMIGNLK